MADERLGMQFFTGAVIALAVLVALIFLPELDAIVLGITLSVLFYPLYRWLTKVMHDRSGGAALVVVFVGIAVILAPLIFFAIQLVGEAQQLYAALSKDRGVPMITFYSYHIDLTTYIHQELGSVMNNFGAIFSQLAGVIGTFFLSFFALYYFLKDGTKLREEVIAHMPMEPARTSEILDKLHVIMSSIVQVSIFMAALYGLLLGFGFFLFGIPNAILWGGATALAAFIPVFGVFLVAIPGVLFLFAYSHVSAAIGLTIWVGFMVGIMEEVVRPRLLKRRTNIHPLLMLFAVLGGLSFFGPIGILLGPIALGLLLSIFEVYPLLFSERVKK